MMNRTGTSNGGVSALCRTTRSGATTVSLVPGPRTPPTGTARKRASTSTEMADSLLAATGTGRLIRDTTGTSDVSGGAFGVTVNAGGVGLLTGPTTGVFTIGAAMGVGVGELSGG